MTKAELVETISTNTGVSKSDVDNVLASLTNNLVKTVLKKGDSISIPGLGTFKQKKTAARKGRNPQTGASLRISAKTKIGFSMSSSLKK